MGFTLVLQQLNHHHVLKELELSQVILYIQLASYLKHDILLPQPQQKLYDADIAPSVLPPSITKCLSNAIGIPLDVMGESDNWGILKDHVWASLAPCIEQDYEVFKEHSWSVGLSEYQCYLGYKI